MHNDDRMDAILERKSTASRDDVEDSRRMYITDHREDIRCTRENEDTTYISEPDMYGEVSEKNEDMVLPVIYKKEKISDENQTGIQKWLDPRISAKEKTQEGEEENDEHSKKKKRNLRKFAMT